MKMRHVVLLSTLAFSTSSIYAQNEKVSPTYGDNPNLFTVLAHKTGQAVQNTVEKVGAVTERGIEKVKPKVGEAWENTRDYSKEQADLALSNTRQGINSAVQKVNDTKDQLIGTSAGSIPIVQGQLSQSSTAPMSQQSTIPQVISPAINPPLNQDNLNTAPVQENSVPMQPQQNADALNDTITVKSVPVTPVNLTPVPLTSESHVSENNAQEQSTLEATPQLSNQNTAKKTYQFDLNRELEKELATP